MNLRVVIKQKRGQRWGRKCFVPDQCVFIKPPWRYTLSDLIEVRSGKYLVYVEIVGLGWEGDEFVINVL